MDIEILRHSCSHVMAQAVKKLWPKAQLAIGPSIADGFYYDFDLQETFTPEDLAKIEKEMQKIIKEDLPLVREELSKKDAIKLFKKLKEDYKVELIEDLPDEKVTIYKTGDKFVDLCRGPHVKSTGEIKAFKLLSVAGAYWHGIETNPMLQRIYGTCFQAKEELDKYLKLQEEAKKRDHRKVGPQLGLFGIYYELAGAGLVLWHPKGAMLRTIVEDYEKREHLKRGYEIVITPHILKGELWKKSGHYDYYKDNMYFFEIDDKEYAVKPMNCPGHMLIYKSKLRSYRDLPIRYFELGTVYRHEKSGVLHGLLRVRGFTQDDAHIFCTPEQLKDEIKGVVEFVIDALKDFGFPDFGIRISTQPKKFIGEQSDWDKATKALEESLEERNLPYGINPGEGAFYGPKIDITLKDALGRDWQCATIQCDFSLPKKFDLEYTDSDGKEKQPIMIHRVILGSIERFIGALIEHYGGAFPLWLAPTQTMIIPIKDSSIDYAKQIEQKLKTQDLRVEVDLRNETLNKKIREAELQKIPYLVIVGDKEVESKKVSVRKRGAGDLGAKTLEDFIKDMKQEILSKK
ncbi:MAG: threonine--tRNA ligase [Candidatus Omnitrophota bacterium]